MKQYISWFLPKINGNISLPFLIIMFLCALNLLFAHYYIMANCQFEMEMSYPGYCDNLIGLTIDLCCFFLFAFIISIGRLKIALLVDFIFTLLWSFSNVLYSRFFEAYISLSSMGQTTTLFDWLMFKCMLHELRWIDLYYVISLIIFFFLYRKLDITRFRLKVLKHFVPFMLLLLVSDLFFHFVWCFSYPTRRYFTYYSDYMYKRHVSSDLFMCASRFTTYSRGFVRTLICEYGIMSMGNIQLSLQQRKQIKETGDMSRVSFSKRESLSPIENVIFIIVESYMSFTSDLKINGIEITPNLNKLKRDPEVFYNGNLCPNITVGESSDGQFIYMTGLLPLRSMLTISKASNMNRLPGLAKILKEHLGLRTRMIIPTVSSMWKQEQMCRQYGFDELYSSSNYGDKHFGNLNDKEVFDLARSIDSRVKLPFFSVILTMSMHQPYDNYIDSSFNVEKTSLSKEQRCYLNACHYTDTQIGNYIDFLRKTGLYEKSLVVIASDHHVNKVSLHGDECEDCHNLPLYIINGSIDMHKCWKGRCNQLDVYPTLLNVLGLAPQWSGLGKSLLNTTYKNSVTDNSWKQSEWIILGDFFAEK